MLAPERHRRILQLVEDQASIRTGEVARQLGVAEETVRRDFEKLEADGLLARTHGGAVRGEGARRDLPISSREFMNVAEKRRIAQAAIPFIKEGETILLDASSTALEMARQLPDMPLTVVTPSLKAAIELGGREQVQVVISGGLISYRSLSAVGALADQCLDFYGIDKAFISCRGVDASRGLSESNEEHARLKRRIVTQAGTTCLLADYSKLPLSSKYFFAPLGAVDVLITDRPPQWDFAALLQAAGVQIVLAE